MIILIDNGHGYDTKGKCSPDKSLLEYAYNREIAKGVISSLKEQGYSVVGVVPELNDISLSERVRRVNEYCGRYGRENCCFVSIHCNAAPDNPKTFVAKDKYGNWKTPRGWCAFTSKGQTQGDKLADCIYVAAERNFKGLTIRKDMSDGDADWEENFTVLAKTKCAACLTENFFMDNKQDVAFMLSDEGKKAIIATIVQGIILYVNKYGKV